VSDLDDLPPSVTTPPRHARISLVWIVPIIAALAAGGIALQRILSEGPAITILFKSSQGIEAGKTFVKYKDVKIGLVTAVQLSGDRDAVEVTAKIAKSAAGLMVEDAKFWVVSPRISLGEVSGLNTLLSGNYIGVGAGKSDKAQLRFTGLEVPQVGAGAEGRQFVLKAKDSGGLEMGSPVYFHRLAVGQVVTSDLSADGGTIEVKVFINEPYDRFIYPETRFWNAGGLDFSVGASGVDIRTTSLAAMIAGGLEFDTPSSANKAQAAAADSAFTLYRDQSTAMRQPEAGAKRYVVHFAESLRGLSAGAPVTFLGLPAGEVTEVGLTYDRARGEVRPRVEIALFPESLLKRLSTMQQGALGERSKGARDALLRHLVEQRGLRAQLRSASLISGQQYVAMDYFPKAPKRKIDWSRDVPELPAVSSPVPDLEAKLASVLTKLDQLPLEAIGADLRKALGAAERAMNGVETGLAGPDAPAQQELRNALQEVANAARALRALADSLERHPESLLRGRSAQKE